MHYIVCGWYTPDYRPWLEPLLASLEAVGAPHDFSCVEKLDGGWERNTLRKARMIEAALVRHPDRVVIFVDVDATVHEALDRLAAIETDIALHMRGSLSRFGKPRIASRSGTIVLRPTAATLSFVRTWAKLSDAAPLGSVDQSVLPVALAHSPGLTITNLPVRYCATAADQVLNPAILHERASLGAGKMPKLLRTAMRVLAVR